MTISIAGAVRRKTTSNPGEPIWPQMAPRAPRPPPTSSGSCCTLAPTGSLRALAPKRSTCGVVQFDTVRLKLINIAAGVIETKTRIKIQLPSAAPCQEILSFILGPMPRLVT